MLDVAKVNCKFKQVVMVTFLTVKDTNQKVVVAKRMKRIGTNKKRTIERGTTLLGIMGAFDFFVFFTVTNTFSIDLPCTPCHVTIQLLCH